MIDQLYHNGLVVVDEEHKASIIFEHFNIILGEFEDMLHSLEFASLGLPVIDLSGLDSCFSEEEVWSVIRAMTDDKAPSPDGFTSLFYQMAWPIIKVDIMRSLATLWSLDARNLYLLNQAYLVLLHKKINPKTVKDYMPISLIHNFSKLFAKILSPRLASLMSSLVMRN
jgi:hypothetical protein